MTVLILLAFCQPSLLGDSIQVLTFVGQVAAIDERVECLDIVRGFQVSDSCSNDGTAIDWNPHYTTCVVTCAVNALLEYFHFCGGQWGRRVFFAFAGLGEPVVNVLDNQSGNDSDTKGVEDCLKWWHCSIINIVGVFAGTLLWHVGMRMRDRQQRVKAERLR